MAKAKTDAEKAADKAAREQKATAKKDAAAIDAGATRDPGNPAAPPVERSKLVRMVINARPGSTIGIPNPETGEVEHVKIGKDGIGKVPRACMGGLAGMATVAPKQKAAPTEE